MLPIFKIFFAVHTPLPLPSLHEQLFHFIKHGYFICQYLPKNVWHSIVGMYLESMKIIHTDKLHAQILLLPTVSFKDLSMLLSVPLSVDFKCCLKVCAMHPAHLYICCPRNGQLGVPVLPLK